MPPRAQSLLHSILQIDMVNTQRAFSLASY